MTPTEIVTKYIEGLSDAERLNFYTLVDLKSQEQLAELRHLAAVRTEDPEERDKRIMFLNMAINLRAFRDAAHAVARHNRKRKSK